MGVPGVTQALVFRIDLHVHTREFSGDAHGSAEEQVERCRSAGLNGLVFTDHGYIWHDRDLHALRQRVAPNLVILSGAEIMFPAIHMIVLGVPAGHQPEFASPLELSRYADSHGGITLAAHPFTPRRRVSTGTLLESRVSGVEVFNGRRHCLDLDGVFTARNLGLAEAAGSDDHGGDGEMGSVATRCARPVAGVHDLICQLKSRETRGWRR